MHFSFIWLLTVYLCKRFHDAKIQYINLISYFISQKVEKISKTNCVSRQQNMNFEVTWCDNISHSILRCALIDDNNNDNLTFKFEFTYLIILILNFNNLHAFCQFIFCIFIHLKVLLISHTVSFGSMNLTFISCILVSHFKNIKKHLTPQTKIDYGAYTQYTQYFLFYLDTSCQ